MTRRPGPAPSSRRALLAATVLTGLALTLHACGGGATTTNPDTSRPSGASLPAGSDGSTLTLPPFPDETPTPPAEASGATYRVVNAWGTLDGTGPSVEIRTSGADGVTLATIAPGEVSEFIAVPKAKFGNGVARLTIVEAGSAPAASGLGPGELQPGDRVTSIVYGYPSQSEILMGIDSAWEAGVAFYGLPWPEDAPAADATLAVYPGPLQYLGDEGSSLTLATADGDCLLDPLFGEPRNGFGGNGATYLYVPGGTSELRATFEVANCESVPADATPITVDATPGGRVLLVPWAPNGEAEFLVLDPSGC